MRNFRVLALGAAMLAGLGGAASMAAAQTQLAAYYAEIGPEDMRNSRGVRLRDTGAILQQDRANFHRFGIRHSGDESDPFFGNRGMRAQIPTLYVRGPRDGYTDSMASWDFAFGLLVVVCGSGGTPQYLVVNPADGDGYNGC